MQQSNVISTIESYGIPTDSYIQAIVYINHESNIGSQNQQYFENGINNIVQSEDCSTRGISFNDIHEARFTFLYLVQESIRASLKNEDRKIDEIYNTSHQLALDFIKNNPYIFAEPEEDIKVDAQGNPKQKKGAKKELAESLYQQHKGKTKQEIMTIFQKEVSMTKSGSQTYYYNCKNKFGE